MDEKCLNCHVVVRPTDFFCYNCGNNLKQSLSPVSLVDQIMLYTKSILIPPFGILWAIKYLKQDSDKSKIVGIVAIILTLTSLLVSFFLLNNFAGMINNQVNQQLKSYNFQ